jgi:hypothetical protein
MATVTVQASIDGDGGKKRAYTAVNAEITHKAAGRDIIIG